MNDERPDPNFGDPSSSAHETALAEMQAMLRKQREVIALLKQEVASLKGESVESEVLEEGNEVNEVNQEQVDVEASPATQTTKRKTIMEVLEEHEKVHTAFYTFDQSMWDAALLLCFHHTSVTDKILLTIGVVINLSLQTLLLVTVFEDMLDNPFAPDTVKEMVRWRVTQGHSTFDPDQGKSLAFRLCNRELWSFEQESYNEMYDYLYKPVPGIVLSTLAIILWVLTIMVEYRRCLEQGLAMYHLPPLTSDDEFELIDDDGNIEIKGIQPCMRWVAIFLMCAPRLAVMAFLAYVGCQYLAQTPSLSDIVLNAVALAFVLDVDELVANVLLTEKLRGLLPKIAPISCGTTRSTFTPFKDLLRYAITIGTITFAIFYWLIPFSMNVEAAAMALCGGYVDFSYTGGIQTDQSIILRPKEFGTDQWVTDCEEGSTSYDFYVNKYYGLGERNTTATNRSNATNATAKKDANYWTNLTSYEVMSFAFAAIPTGTTCPEGQILEPERDEEGFERRCIPFPENLKTAIEGVELKAGATTWPADCPRFDIALGCMPVVLPQSCVWSWLSESCDRPDSEAEGGPPGKVYYDACNAGPWVQCQTWAMFGKKHPSYNCNATEVCYEPEYNCLSLAGSFDLRVSSIDDVRGDAELFSTGLKKGVVSVAGVTEDDVTLTDSLNILPQPDPYGGGYGGFFRRLNAVAGEQFVVTYKILGLPLTVFPDDVLNSTDAIMAAANAHFLNGTNSTNNSTNSSNSANRTAKFSILSLEFVNNTVGSRVDIESSGNDGDGADGGDGGDGDDGDGNFGGDGDDGFGDDGFGGNGDTDDGGGDPPNDGGDDPPADGGDDPPADGDDGALGDDGDERLLRL